MESTKFSPRIRLTCSELISPLSLLIGQHAQHDVEIIAVILDLGALVGVEDVLHHQRMQAEALADLFQCMDVVHPLDIQPGNARLVAINKALLDPAQDGFAAVLLVVIQHRDCHGIGFLLSDMHQRARRQAGFFRAFLKHMSGQG